MNYQEHIADFKTAMALGDYTRALTHIEGAITTRPCDEALPTLTAMRREAAAYAAAAKRHPLLRKIIPIV